MASLPDMYNSGMSIPDIAKEIAWPRSRVRTFLIKNNVSLRSRNNAIRLAAIQGKMGSGLRGKHRKFNDGWCKNISIARKMWGEKHAKGISIKPSGYVEFTRGENKGRLVHIIIMENLIGRPLEENECVHHIDGNRQNNNMDNLLLLNRAEHARIHIIDRKQTRDNKTGRFISNGIA